MSGTEKELELNTVGDALLVTEQQLTDAAATADLKSKPEEKKDDTAAASSDGKGDDKKDGRDPAGVLTADGKHVMPYDVLKGARERADTEKTARLEAERREREARETAVKLEADLKALRESVAAGKGGDKVDDKAKEDRVAALREQAEAIRSEMPAFASMFDSMLDEITDARTAVAKAQTTVETREAEHKLTQAEIEKRARDELDKRVREAIDSNPVLAYWEAQDAAAFDKAAEFDIGLRNDPYWQGKSFSERFDEAVRRTREVLPAAKEPPKVPNKEDTIKAAADLKKRAEKAVEDAKAKGGEPSTLSDLPGGASPGTDAIENIETISPAVLANRMDKMNDAEMQNFLNRFA